MAEAIAHRESRPRAPGIVGLCAALAMLVVIVPLAIRFSQAPAETIAEFAPQVTQQIHKAPNNQTAINGQGQGAGVAGTPTPSPSPSGAAALAGATPTPAGGSSPSELQCVETPGYPPRQIADTQSPPCIPYWNDPKGNGGATYHGVTGSQINIAYWVENNGANTQMELERDLANFFNNHFEFYGRKINFIEEKPGLGCSSSGSTPGERQVADQLVKQDNAFIVLDFYNESSECFMDEAAKDGAIAVDASPYFSEAQMESYGPLMWSYYESADKEESDTGDYVCRSLAGGLATHASGQDVGVTPPQPMNQSKRKFGSILEWDADGAQPMTDQPLKDALARCGVTLADSVLMPAQRNPGGGYADEENPQAFQQVMAKFQSEGITSVVLFGLPWLEQFFASGADSQQYHPEWIMPATMWGNDYDPIPRLFWPDSDQRANQLFGLSWGPRQVAYAASPAQWAVWDTDPSYVFPTASNSGATAFMHLELTYHELLLAAAGIQMAGPNLNPTTFEQGLERTQFPNPPSWQQEGAVGFPGVHYMTQDATVWWWSETAPSVYPDEGPSAMCYEQHGARYTGATFPRGPGDDYFTSACDSGSRPP